jgi:ergothioneine biosynthesis protein EgtB
MIKTTAPSPAARSRDLLIKRFREVRGLSDRLTEPLAPEDCVVQSMPDVSPTKWHLAHTTWFFETFVLKPYCPNYREVVPEYAYLFNSYYNAAGPQHCRDRRGFISRPSVAETRRYRAEVDRRVLELCDGADDEEWDRIASVFELGLKHEQQHQELMLTDIKHVLGQNPLYPKYHDSRDRSESAAPSKAEATAWVSFGEGVREIGHEGSDFAYDNEGPRHRIFLEPFELASRPVTVGEYLAFIEDGGYHRSEFWLSLGWVTARQEGWQAPLYWLERDGKWHVFTLSGVQPLALSEPVCHLSFYEATAYARWAGARLPTEAEWEVASEGVDFAAGNFVNSGRLHPAPAPASDGLQQMFGDVWEWTRSSYGPYPGYEAADGALGEYNGKFMCNQYVLRGGSCATSRDHLRRTYRNFFPPEKRWQFCGLRLARDLR